MIVDKLRDRNIAPNWRPFDDTVKNGELDSVTVDSGKKLFVPSFGIFEDNWKRNHTLQTAVELLQNYYCNNYAGDTDSLINASDYILGRKRYLEDSPILEMASSIRARLGIDDENSQTIKTISPFTIEDVKESKKRKIARLRASVKNAPYSAIRHMELARAFLEAGLWEKAQREAFWAQRLAPDNRYITRSATKCFLHVGEPDKARYVLSKNAARDIDPWLISTAIAIEMQRSNPSLKWTSRKINGILYSDKYSPRSLSELAISFATLESRSGAKNKVLRRLISKALEDPFDNSAAQARWLCSKRNICELPFESLLEIAYNYEVETYHLEFEGKYQEAYDRSILWLADKPFSRRAAIEASNIASIHLSDIEGGITILKAGLIANPNGSADLRNNLVYLYLMKDNLEEAEKHLKLAESDYAEDPVNKKSHAICLSATRGLLYYRQGQYQEGEAKYNEAIEMARKAKNPEAEEGAKLNMILAKEHAGLLTTAESIKALNELDLKHHNHVRIREDAVSRIMGGEMK